MGRIGNIEKNLLLLVPVVILIVALVPLGNTVLQYLHGEPCSTGIPGLNGVGATTKAPGGELIGLSYGATAFDMDKRDRKDVDSKLQAESSFKQNNTVGALLYWLRAISDDSSDAEPQIYLENQDVLASGSSYFTLVVGATLTGYNNQGGRSILQGASIAQLEYNLSARQSGGKLLRLLIANAGSEEPLNTKIVACQIVQAALVDKTIVGVMGWEASSASLNAISVLERAHIPMVSAVSSSESLRNKSPYFWRIVPSDLTQASPGADYAKEGLKAKKVALFEDPGDAYSKSLAAEFIASFTSGSGSHEIIATEQYANGHLSSSPDKVQDALDHNPDLIFFAGYSNDARALLVTLSQFTKQPKYKGFSNLPVMGGDALYVLANYSASALPDFTRLHFTTFASIDEWDFLCHPNRTQICNPPKSFAGFIYEMQQKSFKGGADAMLSYDAIMTLVTAYQNALAAHQTTPTPDDVRKGLTMITGNHSIQGISGQISFGADHEPINKSVVIVQAMPTTDGFVHFKTVQVSGNFLKSS